MYKIKTLFHNTLYVYVNERSVYMYVNERSNDYLFLLYKAHWGKTKMYMRRGPMMYSNNKSLDQNVQHAQSDQGFLCQYRVEYPVFL